MRILTIVGDLLVRGTQRAAQTFSLAYRRAGHDVAVLAHAGDGPRRQGLESQGIPVFLGKRDLHKALEVADSYGSELIHFHRQGHFNSREMQILRRLCRGHRVVLETNVFGRVDYSDCAQLIDVHMPVSGFCLWRWLKRLGRRRPEQIGVLVPNPVETTGFARGSLEERATSRSALGVPADAYVCGYIGFKRSDWAVDGFAHLAAQDDSAWMVCIALPPSMEAGVRALTASIRARIVQVPATQDDRQLCALCSTFDCLLHAPVIGETFGYVVAEALLCGVPVVGLSRPHHDNGHLEVIGHGEGGLIAGATRHYADAILKLRNDHALRLRVELEGPERIRRLFDADMIADRVLRVAGHALAHRDRKDLRRALEQDATLQTSMDDDALLQLMSNTLGGPDPRDVGLMRLLNWAPGQRLVRLLRHRELVALRP